MKAVSSLRFWWWMSLVLMVCIFGVFLSDPGYDPIRMLELEFAPGQESFFSVIIESGYTKPQLEKWIYIDYAFIVAFTALFCFSVLILMRRYNKQLKMAHWALAVVPGILDVFEDSIMLYMIKNGAVSKLIYTLLMIAVYLKWLLVIPCSILAFWVLVLELMGRKKVDGN